MSTLPQGSNGGPSTASPVTSSSPLRTALMALRRSTSHQDHRKSSHSRIRSPSESGGERSAEPALETAGPSTLGAAAAAAAGGGGLLEEDEVARVAALDVGEDPEEGLKIRLVPHLESTRSLHFEPVERTLVAARTIRIGRFTEKTMPRDRITFKSKVVSRGHAELWSEHDQVFIKDICSSSGTFLNHLRLSPPNKESRAYQLKDGDVIQLGVDYQGGTEDIYRCVKIRVELNRSWQKGANAFNTSAMQSLKMLNKSKLGDAPTNGDMLSITDCCICLFPIAPCQALFIAPCSHTYHYKCIRPLLAMHHPGFLCPLCRAFADLDASVEVDSGWEEVLGKEGRDVLTPQVETTERPFPALGDSSGASAALTAAAEPELPTPQDSTLLTPLAIPVDIIGRSATVQDSPNLSNTPVNHTVFSLVPTLEPDVPTADAMEASDD